LPRTSGATGRPRATEQQEDTPYSIAYFRDGTLGDDNATSFMAPIDNR
jgi:hypothetical protein